MLSKEVSVKVKVNAGFKRFLCLLLVLLMFPLDALAVVVPGGGTNIGYVGGKTTKFRFREYVGIALGIQQMQGQDYTVTRPTEKEVAAGKKGTEGLANVTKHFLYSYPNPYSPSGGQGLFYIVPKAAGAPKYVAAVSRAGVGQAPIGSNWCYASSGAFSHTKSDELFKALTSKISDQNPNPSIDPNYFNGLVAKYDKAEAEKLINYIFGRRKSNTEVDVAAINNSKDTSKQANGVGIANTLYWLYQMKQKGYNIPNPEITIFLAQADAIPALSGDAASNLISQTMGYYGDGNEYVPNLDKVKVSSNKIEETTTSRISPMLVSRRPITTMRISVPISMWSDGLVTSL